MLKQGLELKQTQKLSPLQIQTIKLIELPIQELEQRIRKELEENPVLDEDLPKDKEDDEAPREVSLSEYKEDDSIPSYRLRSDNYSKDERPQYSTFSVKESFTQSLMEQLGYRNLTEHQYAVAAFIIGSLDDDGYLRRSLDSLVDDISFRANIETTEEEVLSMLKVIQEFDPVGVGARDLQECLLLQIKQLKKTPDVLNATKILKTCFHDFTSKHFRKIMTRLNLTEEEMKYHGIWREDRKFGDAIFLADAGVQFIPSDMGVKPLNGMHGFDPADKDSCAAWLSTEPVPESVTRVCDYFSVMTGD